VRTEGAGSLGTQNIEGNSRVENEEQATRQPHTECGADPSEAGDEVPYKYTALFADQESVTHEITTENFPSQ